MGSKKSLLMAVLILSVSFSGCITEENGGSNTTPNEWSPEYGVNYTVNVTYVVDGDTFDAVFPSGNEERIRLLGVDCPETTASSNNEYEYGNITDLDCLASFSSEAKSFAESWLNDAIISIQFDETAGFKGYYGRWLAYVYLPNGTDFNAELIEQGYARVYDEGTCTKESYYADLQNQAINQRVGLWGCISSNHPPVADFTYSISDLQVDFTDNSDDEDEDILTYTWDFGDEIHSNEQTPSHAYSTSGTYTVSLTVSDGKSSDVISKQITVTVTFGGNFSIASWNLQVFGPTKASNDTLLNYYADKLDEYDLFIIQEIRDISGTAIEALAEKLPAYEYIISNRAGQSSSKEQYAVFYNSRATLIDSYDYQAEYQEDMQRPPLKVTFISNNWTFTLYTIHTQPDNVPGELSVLETIVGNPTGDTIILGDLNADGSYYDEDNIMHFTDWSWAITNDLDTTVATSDNTYDRIIFNDATGNNFLSVGVMDDVTKSQSDHYLVYAVFNPEVS